MANEKRKVQIPGQQTQQAAVQAAQTQAGQQIAGQQAVTPGNPAAVQQQQAAVPQGAAQAGKAQPVRQTGAQYQTAATPNGYQQYIPAATTGWTGGGGADTTTQQLRSLYQSIAGQVPGEYKATPYQQSDYLTQLQGMYDSLASQGSGAQIPGFGFNYKDFDYSLNGDMLYQNYRDQYMQNGRQAMMDSAGQAAALTGGYGSSYATSASNQAYQQWLTQLNDKVPELYDRAYQKYSDDRNLAFQSAVQAWQAAAQAAQLEQAKYEADRKYAYNALQDQRNFEYQANRDANADALDAYRLNYDRWSDAAKYTMDREDTAYQRWLDQQKLAMQADEIGYSRYQDQLDRDLAREKWDYQVGQDAADRAYQQQVFDYNAGQDAADRAFRERQFDYNAGQDAADRAYQQQVFDYNAGQDAADRAYQQQVFDYNAGQDAADRAFREQQWAYQTGEDARSYANTIATALLGAGQMPSADVLNAAGISPDDAQKYIEAWEIKNGYRTYGNGAAGGGYYGGGSSSGTTGTTGTAQQKTVTPANVPTGRFWAGSVPIMIQPQPETAPKPTLREVYQLKPSTGDAKQDALNYDEALRRLNSAIYGTPLIRKNSTGR